MFPRIKPSQAIDHLADVCDTVLRRGESRDHVGARGAALKLWRFMRPEAPGRLSSAQYHTAARLLTWAEQRLSERADDPANRKDLSSAISVAMEALRDEPPPQVRRRARLSRK